MRIRSIIPLLWSLAWLSWEAISFAAASTNAACAKKRLCAIGNENCILPCNNHKTFFTVVFDLDETLVAHQTKTYNGGEILSFYYRPYIEEMFAEFSKIEGLELVLWTAASSAWADSFPSVAEKFDYVITADGLWGNVKGPQGIEKVPITSLHREIFWQKPILPSGTYTKDLRLLNRPLESIVIIDNRKANFLANPRNAILVPDFVATDTNNQQDITMILIRKHILAIAANLKQGKIKDIRNYLDDLPRDDGNSLALSEKIAYPKLREELAKFRVAVSFCRPKQASSFIEEDTFDYCGIPPSYSAGADAFSQLPTATVQRPSSTLPAHAAEVAALPDNTFDFCE